MIFETQRLIVRPYTVDDADFVFDMYSRWEVQQFLGSAPRPLQSREEALQAIERWRAISDSNPVFGFWAVMVSASEHLVGTVMLKLAPLSAETLPFPLSEDYEVGWHLHPDYWGNGYATEASAGALRRGFDAGAGEVLAVIHPDNQRSKSVAVRLGMEYLGRTERYYAMNADLYRAAT